MAMKHRADEDAEPITEKDELPAVNDGQEPDVQEDQTDDVASSDDATEDNEAEPKSPNILQKFWAKYTARKKLTIPATVLVVLALIFIVPLTRYSALGLVMKQNVSVIVMDGKTNVPVSGVEVRIGSKTAKSDGEGKLTLNGVKVGPVTLQATKKYYKDLTLKITVPLSARKDPVQVKVEATGRQVPLHITNIISGANLSGVHVKASETEAQTDKNGEATIVLPPDKTKYAAEISLDGYNTAKVNITVTETSVKENTFSLTPTGKVYFLSKRTGKIDVMKSDLDGKNQSVVVAGTGNEEDRNTVLLASRDWKYLVLYSRRDANPAKIYLIDTATDKMTEIDGAKDVTVYISGWIDHYFVYQINRNNVRDWQPNKSTLKSFNAESGQITAVDQASGEGTGDYDYAYQQFSDVTIFRDQIVYTKVWYASYYNSGRLAGKRSGVYTTRPSGADRKTVKDFDASGGLYISARPSEAHEVYYAVTQNGPTTYYSYNGKEFKVDKDLTNDKFYNDVYPTYLLSPSGNKTFWAEDRDGKNTLFIGDPDGESGTTLASLSEYTTFGWFTDDYLLVSKNASELYIMPSKGLGDKGQILKITDYHKPVNNYRGYGGGYGGL